MYDEWEVAQRNPNYVGHKAIIERKGRSYETGQIVTLRWTGVIVAQKLTFGSPHYCFTVVLDDPQETRTTTIWSDDKALRITREVVNI